MTTRNTHADMALQMVREARRELLALYLPDPADEIAAATTPVPAQYGDLSRALHAAYDHLLNAIETA